MSGVDWRRLGHWSSLIAGTFECAFAEGLDHLLAERRQVSRFAAGDESLVNLHTFLPPGYLNSVATSVSIANGITYVGGVASRDFVRTEAFVWVLVPSPPSVLLIGAGFFTVLRGRPRR